MNLTDEDNSDNILYQQIFDPEIVKYPPEVEEMLSELFPSSDVLDEPEFDIVKYINALFPTEQSLSSIDEVSSKVKQKIKKLDDAIRTNIRGQTETSRDGAAALEESQKAIETLFVRIKEIKDKAEESEATVREITRDIKQLDNAKRNLTTSITTLNHLQMVISGLDSLHHLSNKRQYGEAAILLEGVIEMMTYLHKYESIPQIKELADEVNSLQTALGEQILTFFVEAFQPSSNPVALSQQLSEASLVINVLDKKYRNRLMKWFTEQHLKEYTLLFSEEQDVSWLDKVERRYQWLKRSLIDFDQKYGHIFLAEWQFMKHISIEFCNITRNELSTVMKNRSGEIDVKILLFAIQRTTLFEDQLNQRFSNPSDKNGKEESGIFNGLISKCFEPHLNIYITSIDKNLSELIERFVSEIKTTKLPKPIDDQAVLLPSCADLFIYYKKCLQQCCQLSTGQPLLSLSAVFAKFLNEYSNKVLMGHVPHRSVKDGGVFSNLLQERSAELPKFTREEVRLICAILSTADYCAETTAQLEDKLKAKIDSGLAENVDLSNEYNNFHGNITTCIQLLVQDLEGACEPALTAMSKTAWASLESVRDTSNYVNAISSHIKTNVVLIRDNLLSLRKYFTQFCIKFASSFISKFITHLFRCKPIIATVGNEVRTFGAEQLLLDTHSLKTILLDLPSVGSQVPRKPPASYTKLVVREMGQAEMTLKVAMSRHEHAVDFVDSYLRLINDPDPNAFIRTLDLKGLKRNEQAPLIDVFRAKVSNIAENPIGQNEQMAARIMPNSSSNEPEASRISRLEKLIKRKL